MDVNKELNFFVKIRKKKFWGGRGRGGGGGSDWGMVGLVGWVG